MIKMVQARVPRSELRQCSIDLEQRHPQARNAHGKRKASSSYAGAEIDGVLAAVRSRGCRQQNRVVTEPVAAQWLAKTKSAAQNGVLADFDLSFLLGAVHEHTRLLQEAGAPATPAPPGPAPSGAGYQASLPAHSCSGRTPANECLHFQGGPLPRRPEPHHLCE